MSCRIRWDRTDVDPNTYAIDRVVVVNKDLVNSLFGRVADVDRWDRESVMVGFRRVQIPLAPSCNSAGLLAVLFLTHLTTIRLTLSQQEERYGSSHYRQEHRNKRRNVIHSLSVSRTTDRHRIAG